MPDSDSPAVRARRIIQKWPTVFGTGPWPLDKSLMAFGFECGPGGHHSSIVSAPISPVLFRKTGWPVSIPCRSRKSLAACAFIARAAMTGSGSVSIRPRPNPRSPANLAAPVSIRSAIRVAGSRPAAIPASAAQNATASRKTTQKAANQSTIAGRH